MLRRRFFISVHRFHTSSDFRLIPIPVWNVTLNRLFTGIDIRRPEWFCNRPNLYTVAAVSLSPVQRVIGTTKTLAGHSPSSYCATQADDMTVSECRRHVVTVDRWAMDMFAGNDTVGI